MGVLDRFERGVESAVTSAFSKAFRTGARPVELISAIKKQADSDATEVDRDRTIIPNEYEVSLGDSDYSMVTDWGREALQSECEMALTEHASTHGYVLVGKVSVKFVQTSDLAPGRYTVRSRTSKSPGAPSLHTQTPGRDAHAAYPLVDVDGKRYHLTKEKMTVGRGSESDIMVDDAGASREHCTFERTPYGTILTDLGSTNGTYVEDERITEVTLMDGNAITVGRTTIMYWDAIEKEAP